MIQPKDKYISDYNYLRVPFNRSILFLDASSTNDISVQKALKTLTINTLYLLLQPLPYIEPQLSSLNINNTITLLK